MTPHYYVQTTFPPATEWVNISTALLSEQAARDFIAQCKSEKPMRIIAATVIELALSRIDATPAPLFVA
jgi:hypothetical protein